MERLLYFLPEKPQPLWVRYATTTVVMALCIAVQIGLRNQTGFVGLFFLLPGIFAAGLMFDRGSSLYATALGTAFAYFSISPTAPFPGYVAACSNADTSDRGRSLAGTARDVSAEAKSS